MFGFGIDKRTLYILLAILAVFTIVNLGTNGILGLLFEIPAVLIALTFHEFAHAYVADKLGDNTPRAQGRLNLNPLSHIDWFGLIMLVVAGFGWGKPVEINRRNFSNEKVSSSAAEAIVAIENQFTGIYLATFFNAGIMYVSYMYLSVCMYNPNSLISSPSNASEIAAVNVPKPVSLSYLKPEIATFLS